MLNQPQKYTVSAITQMIKTRLEESFNDIWVEGEISNYLLHTSGHRYFNLKDDKAVLSITLWRHLGAYLKFEPENGQKVLVYGDITVYARSGRYQLNCRKLVPVGVGELELAFRQLHEKLSVEGLFDDERKEDIPEFAQKIGIVTSPTGAAIRDIIQIAQRRNDSIELIIFPAQVQGEGAEQTIAAGIEYFNQRNDIDIIITGRGGGSLEDLWAFNTEITVRAIVNSKIPVISAVGHEIDTTLADLAADLRAPTPSAASELAVWSKQEYKEQIRDNLYQQSRLLKGMVEKARDILSAIFKRPVFIRPLDIIRQRQQHLDSIMRILYSAGKNSFEMKKNRLSLVLSKLDTLSPLKILARGYSVSRKLPDGKLVKYVSDVKRDDRLETILSDGRIVSLVENIEEDKNK
ncbi:MAG: exodeoxyribonuclease VII large subunit [Candidatus Zixiibacteriota bacterium]